MITNTSMMPSPNLLQRFRTVEVTRNRHDRNHTEAGLRMRYGIARCNTRRQKLYSYIRDERIFLFVRRLSWLSP
jgi:hypothetical protein